MTISRTVSWILNGIIVLLMITILAVSIVQRGEFNKYREACNAMGGEIMNGDSRLFCIKPNSFLYPKVD